jgi:hypothetical protein
LGSRLALRVRRLAATFRCGHGVRKIRKEIHVNYNGASGPIWCCETY